MNKNDFYNDARETPRVQLWRRRAGWALWGLFGLQCAILFFKPITSVKISFAIGSLIIAVVYHRLYRWVTKSGYPEKVAQKRLCGEK